MQILPEQDEIIKLYTSLPTQRMLSFHGVIFEIMSLTSVIEILQYLSSSFTNKFFSTFSTQ